MISRWLLAWRRESERECYPRSPNARTWGTRYYWLFWLLNADEEDVAAVELDGHVVLDLDFFAGPEVFSFDCAAEAQLFGVEMEGVRSLAVAAGIEERDGDDVAIG